MSSQSSWSCRSRSTAERKGLLCGHGIPPVLRVSGTKENLGRRFWGCPHYDVKKECDFFVWADQIQEEGGEDEITRLRRKVQSLKMKVKAAESKMKVAVVVGLIGWVWLLCAWVHYSAKMSPSFVRSDVVSNGLGGL
ncbi:hypothetical protein PIB30_047514 [Stylosanthes scabra]|uniref:GRF-type domain-containing protein n=1 Tax=Stylosanthes scabra TaxID=79078 RepID=A0ABU6XF43_9FABA|nr:hypothetical protein [Stylosanthes scabra]